MSFLSGEGNARREYFIHLSGRCLGAMALCAAIAGIHAMLSGDFLVAVITHLAGATSGGWAGALADRRRLGTHFYSWIMAFTLPLVGGITAYILLETMKKPRQGTLLEDYASYLNDAAAYKDSVPVVRHSMEMEAMSLGDVLANPVSEAEQRIAIEYLAEMETQAAFELLRRTVSVTDTESYFYAMTAITHTEDKMLAHLAELEDSLGKPGQARAEGENLLQVATAYFDFVYYQFAGGERRIEYLEKAERLLNEILDNPASGHKEINEALLLIGKVKLGLNDNAMAVQFFTRYIERNPNSRQGILWRAEAWYNLGEYGRLREDCIHAARLGHLPANMKAVLQLWVPGVASQ